MNEKAISPITLISALISWMGVFGYGLIYMGVSFARIWAMGEFVSMANVFGEMFNIIANVVFAASSSFLPLIALMVWFMTVLIGGGMILGSAGVPILEELDVMEILTS